MKQTAHKGHTTKHAGTTKHVAGKGKHHPAKAHKAQTHHHAAKKTTVHTAAKGHKVAKPRKLAQGDAQRGLLRLCPAPGGEAEPRQLPGASSWALADVSCCAAEALAWSLRLAGWPVANADVLDLYRLTADSPDAGASILATLDAAYTFGLAGVRPLSFEAVTLEPDDTPSGPGGWQASQPCSSISAGPSLILGVELPGPHAVCQQDGQWWTWGEPYDPASFPDAVIEECWQVVWP